MLTKASSDRLDPDALFASLANSRGLLLAVSGGPDSTALLLLIDLWREHAKVPVDVATVDHGLRQESTTEAAQVAALCATLGLSHHTLNWDSVGVRTRVQERAREARYDRLVACAKAIGADTILTAHHADDQAETILMRLTRGSGVAGLAGMTPLSTRDGIAIARPLLGVAKTDLAAVCMAKGAAFVNDPSNGDAKYRRTALRKLAPVLAAEGLDAVALRRLGRRAGQADDALDWALAQFRDRAGIILAPDRADMPMSALADLPQELIQRLLAAELSRLAPQASVRLERLESLGARLTQALADAAPFAATLAGCVVRLQNEALSIALAPPRAERFGKNNGEMNYLCSPSLLGNASVDP